MPIIKIHAQIEIVFIMVNLYSSLMFEYIKVVWSKEERAITLKTNEMIMKIKLYAII